MVSKDRLPFVFGTANWRITRPPGGSEQTSKFLKLDSGTFVCGYEVCRLFRSGWPFSLSSLRVNGAHTPSAEALLFTLGSRSATCNNFDGSAHCGEEIPVCKRLQTNSVRRTWNAQLRFAAREHFLFRGGFFLFFFFFTDLLFLSFFLRNEYRRDQATTGASKSRPQGMGGDRTRAGFQTGHFDGVENSEKEKA